MREGEAPGAVYRRHIPLGNRLGWTRVEVQGERAEPGEEESRWGDLVRSE